MVQNTPLVWRMSFLDLHGFDAPCGNSEPILIFIISCLYSFYLAYFIYLYVEDNMWIFLDFLL